MSVHKYRSHPTTKRWVGEHVVVAEAALGRRLPKGVEVHHVDNNPRNNANANLVICQDKAYHKLLHVRARIVRAGGNPDIDRICSLGNHLAPLSAFNRRKENVNSGLQSACRVCMENSRRARRAAKREAAA